MFHHGVGFLNRGVLGGHLFVALFDGIRGLARDFFHRLQLAAGKDGFIHQHRDADTARRLIHGAVTQFLRAGQELGFNLGAEAVEALNLTAILRHFFLGLDAQLVLRLKLLNETGDAPAQPGLTLPLQHTHAAKAERDEDHQGQENTLHLTVAGTVGTALAFTLKATLLNPTRRTISSAFTMSA